MAWNIDNVREAPTINDDTETNMVFDGRDVWVVTYDYLRVYNYWDATTDYEGLYGGSHPDYPDSAAGSVSVVADVFVGLGTVDALAYMNGKVYMLRQTAIYVFDVENIKNGTDTTWESTISPGLGTLSPSMIAQNNKLWFAPDTIAANGRQSVISYDVGTTSTTTDEIPARKQDDDRVLINGRDNFVFVANKNDSSVCKFDDITGLFVSEIVTNRLPASLFANSSQEILVGGADGMITEVNQTTDLGTNIYGVVQVLDGVEAASTVTVPSTPSTVDVVPPQPVVEFEPATPVGISGTDTYVWSIVPELSRTEIAQTSDNFRGTWVGGNQPAPDYSILKAKFDDVTSWDEILITEEFTYQWWNGASFDTRTVRPYVWLRSSSQGVFVFRTAALYQTYETTVRCSGMVATTDELYYGETE